MAHCQCLVSRLDRDFSFTSGHIVGRRSTGPLTVNWRLQLASLLPAPNRSRTTDFIHQLASWNSFLMVVESKWRQIHSVILKPSASADVVKDLFHNRRVQRPVR